MESTMKFKEYLKEIIFLGEMTREDFLYEAFEKKYTDFGNDLYNKKWAKIDKDFLITFFENGNNIYIVIYRKGHIGFSVYNFNEKFDYKKYNKWSLIKQDFMFTPINSVNALKIFNKIMFIIDILLKKIKPKEIYFNGTNQKLKDFYSVLIKNKLFNDAINKLGYEYIEYKNITGQVEPVYVFTRV